MTNKTVLIFFFFSFWSLGNAYSQINSIIPGDDGRSWKLSTRSSFYEVWLTKDNEVKFSCYGDKLMKDISYRPLLKDELPTRNARNYAESVIELEFPDGVRNLDLTFESAEILDIDGYQTLAITQKDKLYPLRVTEYISVIYEKDLIEKWITVKNGAKDKRSGNIEIERLMSGSIFLPQNDYDLTHYSGWWGHELQPAVTTLTPGSKIIHVRDFKPYGSSFFAVKPTGEHDGFSGEVWFGTVDYSGNWKVQFEKSSTGELQILGGMNFWDQSVILKKGESFTTPKIILGYTREGLSGASRNIVAYTAERLPQYHRNTVRPVIYNSWFATGFGVTENNQYELAKVAKKMGAELFMLDDGWYQSKGIAMSLGDWTEDKNKFPNGLASLVKKVKQLGMEFGIWVEPESVVTTSELYKMHPDWILGYPNRDSRIDPHRIGREDKYYMLNLAREDVYEYLFDSYCKLLKETDIRYLKWDMNNLLTDVGFPSGTREEQMEVRIKYVENMYRLMEELRKEFPDLWIENCAGGGGRIDMGLMKRTDISWVSDVTDPVVRIFMHYSYLALYPASTMLDLVTDADNHELGLSMGFKFDVAMSGILGVGANILAWNDMQLDIAAKKIAEYKEIRPIVQFGIPYRLISPYETNRSAIQYVSQDGEKSVLFIYNLSEDPSGSTPEAKQSTIIRIKGLDPNAAYTIEGMDGTFSGKFLMEQGLDYHVRGAYKSRIFKISKK